MKYNSKKAKEKQKARNEEIRKFLKDNPKAVLMEVGKKYNLTRQRIHQIKVGKSKSKNIK
jgi:DNA-directed RNA polymerase sigma subunit (sigma70/sigma32)